MQYLPYDIQIFKARKLKKLGKHKQATLKLDVYY